MNVNKKMTVRKDKIFVNVISMFITHVNVIKISLENNKPNSGYTTWAGQETWQSFLRIFFFSVFIFFFRFSWYVNDFQSFDRTDQRYKRQLISFLDSKESQFTFLK